MSVPHLLLLAGVAPGPAGVGEIFLHDLVVHYPRHRISYFAATPGPPPLGSDLADLSVAHAPLPQARGVKGLGPWMYKLSRMLSWYHVVGVQVPAMVDRIVDYATQEHVDMLWAVFDCPSLFRIPRAVAERLRIPVVGTIWDPPERVMANQTIDGIIRSALKRDLQRVLAMTPRCGVASPQMGDEYRKKYGIDPVVLIHGIPADLRRPPRGGLAHDGQFVIGFAGTLYASREFEALLAALARVNWQIDGHDVTVRLMGHHGSCSLIGRSRMHIEYLGWRSVQETVDLLAETDVTYLPYWFDPAFSDSVRLCFPNKLTTYLAAGKPVLFHGPADSSPARFFERFPAGLGCHSLEAPAIIECLRRFVRDRDFYQSAVQFGQDALDQELNERSFVSRFADLIGVDYGELLPATPTGVGSEGTKYIP